MNKIIRSAYGNQTLYQDLSTEALEGWTKWNDELQSGEFVPNSMTRSTRVFINNGNLSITDQDQLPPFETDTVRNMELMGHPHTQLITSDPAHVAIAEQKGFQFGMDPFSRKAKGKPFLGVLDTTGGTAVADKACTFALHKAKLLGVEFILGPVVGEFSSFTHSSKNEVIGIQTRDGKTYPSAMIVMACGGWTPSLIPQLDNLCETTAGSVVLLKIPPDSPLFDRYAPENFPTWTYKLRDGSEGGLYGFARDDQGYLKIGYRGTKYTNPRMQIDGKERSLPITRYGSGETIKHIPQHALSVIKNFIAEFLPELSANGINIELTRICWYTDTFDNHFVIDRVPGQESLMVATGGSGHAFKYLPNIGNWVADIMENKGLDRPLIKCWKWRKTQEGMPTPNIIMEGSAGERSLKRTKLCTNDDLLLDKKARL
jgi:sarcosine oxidase/L-pipecolate oxidase